MSVFIHRDIATQTGCEYTLNFNVWAASLNKLSHVYLSVGDLVTAAPCASYHGGQAGTAGTLAPTPYTWDFSANGTSTRRMYSWDADPGRNGGVGQSSALAGLSIGASHSARGAPAVLPGSCAGGPTLSHAQARRIFSGASGAGCPDGVGP